MKAIILGGARCLAADMAAARELFEPDLVIATNHAGRDQARVDHWVTFHPELFPMWVAARERRALPGGYQLWTAKHKKVPRGLEVCHVKGCGGSSSLLAVVVGEHLGCTHMVCCGVPLLADEAHYDKAGPWADARKYYPAWEKHLPRLKERVRSMSGWTRDLLGPPTAAWLGI